MLFSSIGTFTEVLAALSAHALRAPVFLRLINPNRGSTHPPAPQFHFQSTKEKTNITNMSDPKKKVLSGTGLPDGLSYFFYIYW
jgi:hypothetical protein